MGVNLATLIDDGYGQNAAFYAIQIKDEDAACKMIEWLHE